MSECCEREVNQLLAKAFFYVLNAICYPNSLQYNREALQTALQTALQAHRFLAIATNLPEIAIVVSASLTHHPGIAIGNILGGGAIQTVMLVILDGFGLRRKAALTYEAASLQLALEGVLVISVLVISIMGTQLPTSLSG